MIWNKGSKVSNQILLLQVQSMVECQVWKLFDCMNELMDEWINDWMNEWMNEWMIDWLIDTCEK